MWPHISAMIYVVACISLLRLSCFCNIFVLMTFCRGRTVFVVAV